MKKILLIITFFVGFEVNALEINNMYYRKDYQGICDEENKYPIYVMQYNLRSMYFLNLSTNYNLNFEDYYLIDFESSPYSEDIKYFAASDIYSGENDYNRAIHRLIWERLYPDKNFNMCQHNSIDIKTQEDYYNGVKDKIYSIYEGPKFNSDILYLDENKIYEYEYPYLKYFEISASGDLMTQINDTKLSIAGPVGNHQIKFKRKVSQEGFTDILYTDGTNYLLWYPKVIDKEYIVDVKIGHKEIELLFIDEDKNILNDISFLINEEVYQVNENGKIFINSFDKELNIKLLGENNIYDEYELVLNIEENQNFEIVLKKKEVIKDTTSINPEENIVIINPEENSKDNIIIEVEDTLSLPKVYLLLIIMGLLHVKFFKN